MFSKMVKEATSIKRFEEVYTSRHPLNRLHIFIQETLLEYSAHETKTLNHDLHRKNMIASPKCSLD